MTFDDGYIDNYTQIFPILDENNIQGSFFIPGKTFTEHKLLDVNKIHFILASADSRFLLSSLFRLMDHYRGSEFSYPDNETLFALHAKANRFDTAETIFIKRMLQTVLPERLRNILTSELFSEHVGIPESVMAHELYMSLDQVKTLKRHGMFIGVHGYNHYWLADLPAAQMQEDIRQALDVLDTAIDRNAWVMNYPYGNYNQDVISYISNLGAVLGLAVESRVASLETDNTFTLPRFDCNDFPPKSENYRLGNSRLE